MNRVRIATPEDVNAIRHIQNRHSKAIGYLPGQAIEERAASARIIVIEENEEPAGFITFTHRRDGRTHVSQLAIDEQLWLLGLGSRCMEVVAAQAADLGQLGVTLKCALDLPAQRFWPRLGFQSGGLTQDRYRQCEAWCLRLTPDDSVTIEPPKSQWRNSVNRLGLEKLGQFREPAADPADRIRTFLARRQADSDTTVSPHEPSE